MYHEAFDVSGNLWHCWPAMQLLPVTRKASAMPVTGIDFSEQENYRTHSQLRTEGSMNKVEFKEMLEALAAAWQRKDYAAAAELFAEEIQYADPLRYALDGKAQLRAFFEADEGYAQCTVWRAMVFDEEQQMGFAEYTFDGTHRYHGAVIIKVQNDKITHWREYQHIDPRDWPDYAGSTAFDSTNRKAT